MAREPKTTKGVTKLHEVRMRGECWCLTPPICLAGGRMALVEFKWRFKPPTGRGLELVLKAVVDP